MPSTIEDLQAAVAAFRDERDWLQFHNLKDLTMALSIEAGELCELLLWKGEAEIQEHLKRSEFRKRISEELADLQIFLMYISDVADIPIEDAVRTKLALNAEKYPVDTARGSAKKYDEI
jgi:NTP pyrophosphatase (non-canonical NTP hydrolase)